MLVDKQSFEIWLVLEPGHLLMTGALGGPQAGLAGRYLGDYGSFGRIEFEFIDDISGL